MKAKVPVEYSRFISTPCATLESKATMRIMEAFTAPHGGAVAFPGSDGKLDLYIDYQSLAATLDPRTFDSLLDLPPHDPPLRSALAFEPPQCQSHLCEGLSSHALQRLAHGRPTFLFSRPPKPYHSRRTHVRVAEGTPRLSLWPQNRGSISQGHIPPPPREAVSPSSRHP